VFVLSSQLLLLLLLLLLLTRSFMPTGLLS
jgi:hypothetical protein